MRQPGEPIFTNREFHVIEESDDWIVVDKPPHLVVHPTVPNGTFTLWHGLRELLAFELANGGQVSIINRLDRETSGLVLIAKHRAAARSLAMAMQAGSVKKEYLAIVLGHPTWTQITVDAPVLRKGSVETSRIYLKQMVHSTGAAALTDFEVLERFLGPGSIPLSLVRAIPLTGRTHQIRVHAAHLGFPLLGDKIYGADEGCYLDFIETGWTETLAARLLHPRHALHSAFLSLPELGLEWRSPLPADLQKIVDMGTCSHA
ncbi:MAG: RluA family pseudouridine synthase [Chthoniobacterales bacterium]